MALKDTWIDKVNEEDIIDADDINDIAHAVIDIEENGTGGGGGGTGGGASLSDSDPVMNGTAFPGTSSKASRADHVHPSDTTRMAEASSMYSMTTLDQNDAFIVHDFPANKTKKMAWSILKSFIASEFEGNIYAAGIMDSEGNVATVPELDGGAVLALVSQIPTTLAELSGDSTHRTVTDVEKSAWNAKSNFSGNYADLSGKPTIPTKPSDIGAQPAGNYVTSDKTITIKGVDESGTTHTWTVYGV